MDRDRLILTVAATLFGVFLLGWIAGWIVTRLGRAAAGDAAALDDLAQQLTRAEATRDAAHAEARQARDEQQRDARTLELAQAEIEDLRGYIERRLNRQPPGP